MATKKLIANERFYYAGHNVEMGEEFDCEEVDVALLTHAVKPMAKVAETGPEPEPQAKRTYKRRDMKAED